MIKRKQRLLLGVVLLMLSMMNAALAEQNSTQDHKELYPGKIKIGYVVFPGYFPLIVAHEKGYFKEEGLDVEIKQYVGLTELSQDYVAGKMQGRANLTLDMIKETLDGFDQRVVLAIDYSNGADAIMAVKGIETVLDFKGKRVAYEFQTLEEFFLTWALTENDMSLSDIIPVAADPEKAAKLLKEGQVDVAVTYEPFISQYLTSGDFHPVYTSQDAPGLIMDILTFRTDFIEAHPETIEAVLRAYFKGLAYSRKYPEEAYGITAKQYNDTAESVGRQLKGIKTLDEIDNQIAFTFAAGLKSLYGNMRQVGKFVLKQSPKNSVVLNTDQLIERRFIKKISQEAVRNESA